MKLGIFSTHPIQYQIPIWRLLSKTEGLEVTVFYFSDQGVGDSVDPGFGQVVIWDVPLLEGYEYEFLSKAPVDKSHSFHIATVDKFLRSQQFDVVLLHGYTHKFARQLVRRKQKYGYTVILRGEFTEMPRRSLDWKKLPRKAYLKWFYRHVDHFCPIGEDAKDHLRLYGVGDAQMTLAPYSVDDTLIDKSSKKYGRSSSRSLLGINDKDVVFLFSGKMMPRKQPLLLAEAILSLSNTYGNVTAIFLGSGEQYQALCEKLEPQLNPRFIAPGFVNQSELGLYFTAADVFVLPSIYDTWGLVVNEAMHYGLPCIVSDKVGSGRDLVKSGETGEIFRFDSLKELQRTLEKFMEAPERAKIMGENAFETIQGYTIGKTLRGLELAIQKVSNE